MGWLQGEGGGLRGNTVVSSREDRPGKRTVKNSGEEGKEQSWDQMNGVLSGRARPKEGMAWGNAGGEMRHLTLSPIRHR